MTEWKQERPPLTDEHLAEIRERTKNGHILDWPSVDRAVLLSEVDRLRKQVATLIEDRAHWKGHAEEHQHALHLMMLTCNEERVRADTADREVDRLRAQVADVEALLRNDDYDPYVHANEGCQGEPDCARCWADDVRNALRGHRG